jgi:hypothetical protein
MSRRRYLSSDISTDPRVAELAEQGALPVLLYTWAITHADDWGRMTGEARQFKLLVCPGFDVTAREVDAALTQIAAVGLWLRYTVGGRVYLAFPPASWFKYQTYIGRDKRAGDGSAIPAPADAAWRIEPDLRPEIQPEIQPEVPDVRSAHSAERRETPLRARTPSPSPSPSLSPTVTPDGQYASGERDNVRAREADEAAAAETAAMGDLAADAALSLDVTPTLLPVHPAPAAHAYPTAPPAPDPAPHPAAPPAKVTPLHVGTVRVPSRGDPVWDACIAAMSQNGAAPSNRVERGKWAKGIQALKESLAADGAPPGEIGIRAQRYRSRFGTSVPLNPMALAGNWTTLAVDLPRMQESGQEGQRHGNFTPQRSGSSRAYGRAGWRHDGRVGKPQVGTPEYYAQAIAEQYG